MLDLRPNCECCNKTLPPESNHAFICSFECTFCSDCVQAFDERKCPNCNGNLMQRPIRPAAMLAKYPASIKRIYNQNCKKNN